MAWIWFTWLGCSAHSSRVQQEAQCDREVIALKDHVEMLQGQLANCTTGDAPNEVYPELKQVFSGSDVSVDKEGTATRLTVKVSTLFTDPYLMKFRTEADPTVELLVTAIQRHPESRIIVVGHTNDRPIPPSYHHSYPSHLDWSVRLAEAVVGRFVDQYGCNEAQFGIAGRGEHAPLQSNDLDTGRDANQRLEIWLYPPTDAPPGQE